MNDPLPSTEPPDWPYCGTDAHPVDDPVGCRGERVSGTSRCLTHLNQTERDIYYSSLREGSDLDHRATHFTSRILSELLHAVRNPSGAPNVGIANFTESHFIESAAFSGAVFSGRVDFGNCHFYRDAHFDNVTFSAEAYFGECVFRDVSSFGFPIFKQYVNFFDSKFMGQAVFVNAKFEREFSAEGVEFQGGALFAGGDFSERLSLPHAYGGREVVFSGTVFGGKVWIDSSTWETLAFYNAVFEVQQSFEKFSCRQAFRLSGSHFAEPLMLSLEAKELDLSAVRMDSAALLRMAGGKIDLTGMTAFQSISVSALYGTGLPYSIHPEIQSLRGVDCAMLTLTDVDLKECKLAGAIHLDQLHLEGAWRFRMTPFVRIFGVFRYSRRQVIAEERDWRASDSRSEFDRRGWGAPSGSGSGSRLPVLEIVYRQLRKAREDAKDEPGAADFYYGEMEMRRHGKHWSTAERWLLQAYWLLSGYGLRASRALGWLSLAMMTTILLMMSFGLPQDSPKQLATGIVPSGGGRTTFEIDTKEPRNPTGDHFTGERFNQALNVTLNSVVFRSSGQNLTTAGGYIEMASRFSEPVLIGLAALAIRGRVKR